MFRNTRTAVADPEAYQRQIYSIGEQLAESPRWAPFCEGLEGSDRAFLAILLENELTHLSQLSEVTKTLAIGNFD